MNIKCLLCILIILLTAQICISITDHSYNINQDGYMSLSNLKEHIPVYNVTKNTTSIAKDGTQMTTYGDCNGIRINMYTNNINNESQYNLTLIHEYAHAETINDSDPGNYSEYGAGHTYNWAIRMCHLMYEDGYTEKQIMDKFQHNLVKYNITNPDPTVYTWWDTRLYGEDEECPYL